MIMNLVANASLEVKLGSPKQPGESFAESRRVVGFDAAQESHVVIKPKFSCRCTILHDKFDTIRPVDHCDHHGDGYETAHKHNRKKREIKLGSPKQPRETCAQSRRVVGFDAAQESHVVIKPKFSCRCTFFHDKVDTITPVDHCDNRGD